MLALFVLAGSSPALRAHELEVGCKVLPQRRVLVEAAFDTKQPARNARVKVTRANHEVLTSGRLDDQGRWVFAYHVPEALTVVVSDGAGHRAEAELLPRDLFPSYRESLACAVTATLAPEGMLPGLARLADHLEPVGNPALPLAPERTFIPEASSGPAPIETRPAKSLLREAIIGLAFLLGLAAFLMSLRNSRRLRELEDHMRKEKGEG